MTQQEYETMVQEFLKTVDLVRLEAYAATGFEWIVVPKSGGYRSIVDQDKLYAQGRTTPGSVITRARGGQSPHNFNLARDITPCKTSNNPWWDAPKSVWKVMSDIAVKHGLVWGGNFKTILDVPHIEHKDWKLVQAAWKKGQVKCG